MISLKLVNESLLLTNQSRSNTMLKQKQTLNDTTCCVTVGDPWDIKQHHRKSESVDPGEPSNRRRANQLKYISDASEEANEPNEMSI